MRIILLAVASFLTACGGSTPSVNNNESDPSIVIGEWQTVCYEAVYDSGAVWTVGSYSITDTTIEKVDSHYSDGSCTSPYTGELNLWEGYSGTYTYLGNVDTSSGIEALLFRHTFNSGSPLNTEIVVDSGFYVDGNVLYQVWPSDDTYNIIYAIPYYKQ